MELRVSDLARKGPPSCFARKHWTAVCSSALCVRFERETTYELTFAAEKMQLRLPKGIALGAACMSPCADAGPPMKPKTMKSAHFPQKCAHW